MTQIIEYTQAAGCCCKNNQQMAEAGRLRNCGAKTPVIRAISNNTKRLHCQKLNKGSNTPGKEEKSVNKVAMTVKYVIVLKTSQ